MIDESENTKTHLSIWMSYFALMFMKNCSKKFYFVTNDTVLLLVVNLYNENVYDISHIEEWAKHSGSYISFILCFIDFMTWPHAQS